MFFNEEIEFDDTFFKFFDSKPITNYLIRKIRINIFIDIQLVFDSKPKIQLKKIQINIFIDIQLD